MSRSEGLKPPPRCHRLVMSFPLLKAQGAVIASLLTSELEQKRGVIASLLSSEL